MRTEKTGFEYEVYESIHQLAEADASLLQRALQATADAYAPYSSFKVGAAASLGNGEIITGANQENASFPAGICAERAMLAAALSRFPGVPVQTIAVSYDGDRAKSDHPISPCGICRQVLVEYESGIGKTVRLILGGRTGPVFIIPSLRALLPLAFTADDLP